MKKLIFLLALLFIIVTPQVSFADFTRDLEEGSVGEDVKELQQFLNANGFIVAESGSGSPGNETVNFGPATKRALIKFQIAHNINPAVGYFGPLTRNFVASQPQRTTNFQGISVSSGVDENLIIIYPSDEDGTAGIDINTSVTSVLVRPSSLNFAVDSENATIDIFVTGSNADKFWISLEGNAPVVFKRKSSTKTNGVFTFAVNTTRAGLYQFAFTIRENNAFGRVLNNEFIPDSSNMKITSNTSDSSKSRLNTIEGSFSSIISGSVIDDNNNPYANLKVYINTADTGVVTDSNGNFSIDASKLKTPLKQGALFKLSVDVPGGFSHTLAKNARLVTSVYNWQALGLDCQNTDNLIYCEEFIKKLYSNYSESKVANFITQTKAQDLASEKDYVFIVKKTVQTTSSTIPPNTSTSDGLSGTQGGSSTTTNEPTTGASSGSSSEDSTSPSTPSATSVELVDLSVYVLDPEGKGVAGVPVKINVNHEAKTNENGVASFPKETTKLRKGSIVKISADIPSGYDYIRAVNSREVNSSGQVNASVYNWQVLGVNCTSKTEECRQGLEYANLASHIDTAVQYDTDAKGIYVFTLGKFPSEISGRVIDQNSNPVAGVIVGINNTLNVVTGNNGLFKFTPSDIGIVKGGNYALRISPPSGMRSQALIKTDTPNWDSTNCGADTTTPAGTCVLGAGYEDQILGEQCMGRSGGTCINFSYRRDLPSDTEFIFRLKSNTDASAIDSGSFFSRVANLFTNIFK